MNTDQLIDSAVQFYDNTSDADGGYGSRVTRTLLYGQQVNDEIHHLREWSWKVTSATGSLAAGVNILAQPADYEELGTGGGLFMGPTGVTDGGYTELEEITVEELSSYLRTLPGASGSAIPTCFAVYGGNFNFPTLGSGLDYKLVYSKTPQTLAYGTAQTLDLPARYHHSVLLPGVVARMQQAKGDARTDWSAQYARGLAEMIKRERPRKTVVQLIPAALPPYHC